MSGSYNRINYSLRLAKGIERKMICETFKRLSSYHPIYKYRYIGFGSTYFSDFYLFHKALGISDMISIEKDDFNEDRFEFNLPYSCIDLKMGNSTDIIPKLTWEKKTLLWLDYDGYLEESFLSDISFFCSNAPSGSVLIVSVNVHPEQNFDDKISLAEHRLKQLKTRLDGKRISNEINGKLLRDWGLAKISKIIINDEILSTLNKRQTEENVEYKQLFNFFYADGANMLTTGGILHNKEEAKLVQQCSFDDLEFIRSNITEKCQFTDGNFTQSNDKENYLIEVPNLTRREIRRLDEQLPTDDYDGLLPSSVPTRDKEAYGKFYRYFPTFTEADI